MTKNKLAFSVMELAAVVLVIGLITVGIIKGTSLIRSSQLSSARSLTVKSRISEISGMVAWYETSMIESLNPAQTTDLSQITEWRDISPGSIAAQKNKLTRGASNTVTYKTEGINDLPSINFSSSGSISLAAFYQGGIGQNTIFVVMRPTVAVGGTTLTLVDSHSSSSTNSMFGIISNKIWFDLGSSLGTAAVSNVPAFTANSNYIVASYYDNTNSKAFVNNATSMAGGTVISPGTNQMNGLTIGSNRTNTTPFTGLISEVIIFDRPLPIEERKSVMSYLSKKYKITVSGI